MKYSVYDYNYGEAAHEAFTRATGKEWRRADWDALDQQTRDAWVAAAIVVMDTFAGAALV